MNHENNNSNPQQPTPYQPTINEGKTDASYTTDNERETSSDMQTGGQKPSQHSAAKEHNTEEYSYYEGPKTGADNMAPDTEDNAYANANTQERRGDLTPNLLASVAYAPPESKSSLKKRYQALVAITHSSKPAQERIAAIRELANYGQFITPNVLMLAMIDQDKFVRIAVLETCADLALHIPVKLVESALADSAWIVRATAVWALSHFGNQAPLQHIATIADDTNESILVRFWALYALGKIHDVKSTNRFLAILNNSKTDEHLREASATALGLLGSVESPLTLQLLRHALANEEENALVRIAAAHSLAQLSNPPEEETLQALTKALRNKDEDIREAADHALNIIAEQVGKSIDKQSKPQSNRPLITALLLLHDRISEDVLIKLLSHTDRAISKAAFDMLTAPDDPLPAPDHTVAYLYNRSTLSIQDEREKACGLQHMAEGTFIPLTPGKLKSASISQALDDGWIPRSLLTLIMVERSLTADDISAYLAKQLRTEYIRSLLHNRSVAITLTLLYSSPVIYQDFLEGSSQREAFQWLLKTGVIVPVLIDETAPDAPSQVVRSVVGLSAWERICREGRMACISLPKTNTKPLQTFKQLIGNNMLQNTHLIAEQIQTAQKTQESTSSTNLELSLRKLANFVMAAEQDTLTLEELYETLYKHFILVEDSNSRERIYDGKKEAAHEIKQVIDLAYHASIADALQSHLLTPGDTLPRTVLQEWRTPPPATSTHFSLEALITTIESCHFDTIRSDWYLKSLRFLSLQDVVEIRASREWDIYIQSVEALMKNKSFAQRGLDALAPSLEHTYNSYQHLLDEINSMLEHRRTASNPSSQHTFWTKWTPTPELQINVGGAILLIRWTQDGMLYSFAGNSSPDKDHYPALTISFSIGEHRHTTASTDLSINFDLCHGRLDTKTSDAYQQWEKLKMKFHTQPPSQLRQQGFVKTGPTLS